MKTKNKLNEKEIKYLLNLVDNNLKLGDIQGLSLTQMYYLSTIKNKLKLWDTKLQSEEKD